MTLSLLYKCKLWKVDPAFVAERTAGNLLDVVLAKWFNALQLLLIIIIIVIITSQANEISLATLTMDWLVWFSFSLECGISKFVLIPGVMGEKYGGDGCVWWFWFWWIAFLVKFFAVSPVCAASSFFAREVRTTIIENDQNLEHTHLIFFVGWNKRNAIQMFGCV